MLFWLHGEIGNGFHIVLGNGLDGRIQVSLTEHWLNVLRGVEAWNAPAYFYPWADTLGYNDGYLLFGVVAAIFRACGADPFLAFDCAAAIICTIGFLSCALLSMDALGMGVGYAVLTAIVFTTASNAAYHRGHAQLVTVALVPLLGWLTCRCLYALRARADLAALGWGLAAAMLYSAWLLTAFYMAWFTTFFAALLLLSFLVLQSLPKRAGPGGIWSGWRNTLRWPLVCIVAVSVLGVVPFLAVYLPKSVETGAHPFAEVLYYAPSLPDLIHFGRDNWLFGSIDEWLTRTFRPDLLGWSEHLVGYPPFLIGFGLAGAIAALAGKARPILWRAVALATLVAFALVLEVWGHTAWYWVFAAFPGASAIRVTSRFLLFLDLPLAVLAVGFLAHKGRRWPTWLMALCIGLLAAEELTSFSPLGLDRNAEMRLLASVPATPAGCASFYVTTPWPRASSGNTANDALYTHNVDAMVVSAARGLPTLNGIASFNPPDWAFADPGSENYAARVRSYAGQHGLKGVCSLDLKAGVWTTEPFREP